MEHAQLQMTKRKQKITLLLDHIRHLIHIHALVDNLHIPRKTKQRQEGDQVAGNSVLTDNLPVDKIQRSFGDLYCYLFHSGWDYQM